MSYEGSMLAKLKMPSRSKVSRALLVYLFNNGGSTHEFGHNQRIVNDLAEFFGLKDEQRTAYLETIYRKENRVKKSYLWHRLLFRAADELGKTGYISRPSETVKVNSRKEWMLTEKGFDKVLEIMGLSKSCKDNLLTKSIEVQRIVKKLIKAKKPKAYSPFDHSKKRIKLTKETQLRKRGFRQAIIHAYDFKCAVCGLKISSPDLRQWEVEAAHIVPNKHMGKDDVWNGLALCRLHHWAFDVGWFSINNDFTILGSSKLKSLDNNLGYINTYDFKMTILKKEPLLLPENKFIYPDQNSILWHRENIFIS